MPNLNNYLETKRQRMAELSTRLQAPEAAPVPIAATVRVAGGSGIRPVQVRDFTFITDSGPAMAGHDLGPTAPELLLSALASCLAHTFLIVAARQEIPLESLEVEVRGEIDFRGVLEVTPEAPIPPQNLTYEARLRSSADDEMLQTLRSEVERLCPVFRALVQPMEVKGSVKVLS